MAQEKLSALMDGECTSAELDALLDEMDRAPELKQCWSRMCAAHDARTGTRIGRSDVDIAAGVMVRLAAEAPPQTSTKVVELATRRPRRTLAWRPAAGFAAAASVAALAVTLGLNFGSVDEMPGADRGVVLNSAGAVDAALRGQDVAAIDVADEDLNQYLIEHSNTMADRGVGGTLSYARFAARSADAVYAQPASYGLDGSQP